MHDNDNLYDGGTEPDVDRGYGDLPVVVDAVPEEHAVSDHELKRHEAKGAVAKSFTEGGVGLCVVCLRFGDARLRRSYLRLYLIGRYLATRPPMGGPEQG